MCLARPQGTSQCPTVISVPAEAVGHLPVKVPPGHGTSRVLFEVDVDWGRYGIAVIF